MTEPMLGGRFRDGLLGTFGVSGPCPISKAVLERRPSPARTVHRVARAHASRFSWHIQAPTILEISAVIPLLPEPMNGSTIPNRRFCHVIRHVSL